MSDCWQIRKPSGRALFCAACLVACASAAWWKGDAIVDYLHRPTAPATVTVVQDDLLFADKLHEYEIGPRRGRNVVLHRGGWVFYNDAETGDWRASWGPDLRKIRPLANDDQNGP